MALVETFERLFKEAIYRHRSFPVPTSFLIDRGGWLTVIYKGAFPPERILDDVAKLGLGPEVARRESLPFAGRWGERHFASHPIAVARAYQEAGHREDARAHLQRFLADHRVAPGSRPERSRAAQLADVHHLLGELLAAEGEYGDAVGHFKAAAHFVPSGRFEARKILGMAQAGDVVAARREAAAMRQRSPANPDVLALNGDVALIAGDEPAAAEAFGATLSVDPRYIPVLKSLARLLASASDPSVRDPERALQNAKVLMGAPGAKDDPLVVATLALAYRAASEPERAQAAFARAAALARRAGDPGVMAEVAELREKPLAAPAQ